MIFQERDGQYLHTLYYFGGGVLDRDNTKKMYWPNSSDDAMRKRLNKLKGAGYITWPTKDQYRNEPIPKSVVYLDWRGILWIAKQYGVEFEEKKPNTERERNALHKALKETGIFWRRLPKRGGFSNLKHDLMVIEFKLAFEQSVFQTALDRVLGSVKGSINQEEYRLIGYAVKYLDGVFNIEKLTAVFEQVVTPDGEVPIKHAQIVQISAQLERRGLLLSHSADDRANKRLTALPFILKQSIPEFVFRLNQDEKVSYQFQGADGRIRRGEKGVVPDNLFILENIERRSRGDLYFHLALPMELDRGTAHTVKSKKYESDYGRDKALPYAAYLATASFRNQAGLERSAGRWLVVTSGDRRMKNLMTRTKEVLGKHANLFLFSHFEAVGLSNRKEYSKVQPKFVNLLSDAIWYQVDRRNPLSLVSIE